MAIVPVANNCFRGEYIDRYTIIMTDQSVETHGRLFVVHAQMYVAVVLVKH